MFRIIGLGVALVTAAGIWFFNTVLKPYGLSFWKILEGSDKVDSPPAARIAEAVKLAKEGGIPTGVAIYVFTPDTEWVSYDLGVTWTKSPSFK